MGANSGPTSNGAKPYFMVLLTSLMVELVHETIKYGLAPSEVGPEFAPNSKVWLKTHDVDLKFSIIY